VPTPLTVGTEAYLLARRLYLYAPTAVDNPHVKKFIDFALSSAGQDIVRQKGFVSQNVLAVSDTDKKFALSEYKTLTDGAKRLALNFHFRPGFRKLDNKALRDIQRVVDYVSKAEKDHVSLHVILVGFSDVVGDDAINLILSSARVKVVAEELSRHSVNITQVTGLGAAMPVASNASKKGRERNRRVEIWIKPVM